MRLEWLEDILAVAETGSLSEAAERRHLTQSAFSRRVQAIEDYVGVELFDRGRKPVHLRAGTQSQRDQMQRLAQDLRQLVEELRQGERHAQGRVVLASQHALTTALTPGLIRRVQAQRGEVQVRLRSANFDDCFGLLLSRQADLALVYDHPGSDAAPAWRDVDYIEHKRIGRDVLVPVAHPDLAQSLRQGLDAQSDSARIGSDLPVMDLPYIAYPDDVFLGRVMAQDIRPSLPAGLHPMPRVETALTPAAVELAAEGLGVAWVPRTLVARIGSGRDLVELSQILPVSPLNVLALRLVGQGGAQGAGAAVWAILSDLEAG